jgi:hypothetical protein
MFNEVMCPQDMDGDASNFLEYVLILGAIVQQSLDPPKTSLRTGQYNGVKVLEETVEQCNRDLAAGLS